MAAGAVASATPSASVSAARPAVAAPVATAAAVRDDSLDRTTRLLATGRPAITGSAEAAKTAEAEKKKTKDAKAEKKAKDAKAEKKKKADKAKAKKEAEAKKKKKAASFRPTAKQLEVVGHRYTRVSLNVRSQPKNSASLVAVLKTRSRVSITDTTKGSWTLVIHRGKGRWVHTRYLVRNKPKAKSSSSDSNGSGGISMARCSSSKMESGLTRDAIRVHRALCHRYPQVSSFGGRRSGGESFHWSGRAVDVMISSSSTGWKIARWVRANRKALGVSEVIYSQKIWTVQRSSEGWRSMSDRGNATANHYDHVHVSVYGNRGRG